MLVAVRAACVAAPKAVLTELVVVALLAPVAEAHHALTAAVRTLHRMEDWEGREEEEESEAPPEQQEASS